MSRTAFVFVLVVLLLAAVFGIGWLLRPDAPAGPVAAPGSTQVEPDERDATRLSEPLAAPATGREVAATEHDQVEPEIEAASSSTTANGTPEPSRVDPPPSPTVRVYVRTPSGESFSEATGTSPFLFRAVATRTQVGGTWPPADGEPPVDVCHAPVRGRETIEDGLIGRVALRCDPPLWIALVHRSGNVMAAQVLQAGVDEVVFVVEPNEVLSLLSSVRARAVDAETGEPIEGAHATLFASGMFSHSPSGSSSTVVIEKIVPGSARFSIGASGFQDSQHEIELEPGSDLDLGDVPLVKLVRHELLVLVRGPEGTTGRLVRMIPAEFLSDSRGRGGISVEPIELEDGEERLTLRLEARSYAVWAEGRAAEGELVSAIRLIEVEPGGGQATLELVRPASVAFRNGPERVSVLPRTLDGIWAHEPVRLEPDGEARIELVPGTYELVVRAEGKDERVLPLQVGAPESAIDLR